MVVWVGIGSAEDHNETNQRMAPRISLDSIDSNSRITIKKWGAFN